MPTPRSRASFEPISPDLDVTSLVESTPNFELAPRIPYESIEEQGLDRFEKLVLLHVVIGGKPLVIEGFEQLLDKDVFSEKWLRCNYNSKVETARDLTNKSNLALTVGHYLKSMPLLTDQWNERNYKDRDRQRIYLKDIDCPALWYEKLKDMTPPALFYHNNSVSILDNDGEIPSQSSLNRQNVSVAGDLMSCLPINMRADNLMCYIGHEGTYTPSHREMCASLGHNLMVETSTGLIEYGKKTKPGSSIWFMTESKERKMAAEYWISKLGHDIELEDHFAQLNAWRLAPFKTYMVEQKLGDFILIPPLAVHQVWNRGTRTMKIAWNRTTVETLDMALNEALHGARMVCRDEQYKNKAIVYYALQQYSDRLRQSGHSGVLPLKVRRLQKDFTRLFTLFTEILVSESFSEKLHEENVEFLPFDGNITCSYCRCNIFNRFLSCPWCAGNQQKTEMDPYDICMECYAMGRSCACISGLKWVEQFRWGELIENHEIWWRQILKFDSSCHSLSQARGLTGKKALAEVCQEELKKRPWVDITKPVVREVEGDGLDLDEDVERAHKRRKKSKPSAKWLKEMGRCHVCKTLDPLWKLASCTTCDGKYCYGSLFRAFNWKPQEIMETLKWECPKCRKICNCGACRRNPSMTPFQHTSISLGHDTKKIADPRSVEVLVNFSHSNIQWMKKANDDSSEDFSVSKKHLKKQIIDELDSGTQPLDDHHIGVEEHPASIQKDSPDFEDIPVDPALKMVSQGIDQFHNGRMTWKESDLNPTFAAKSALDTLS
ncbi:hypothetical protein ASPZODRAFT_101022 [Penicilliopsis zonata CBS 506.65]|uniref:JmjC domain-containing protein n=1 Tax=Penicilliopsis zonata CBS 506.65 TaxID=1073090 RepID=A0A1L9SCG8_9EURO|nr:hypothetical protein ASPZODRAFT_101022 [Penicilliopsis zonata CBS 506.65]OJJ44832.1 hypothetical protein ASPZODRAFT_101022 [Penicilliopsis zonata CBS 506.65]